jgi:nucleobase:cation symporter-1, NCS1 family
MTEVTEQSLAIKAERGEIPTTAKDRSFGHWDSIFVMASFGVATWNYVLGGWIASFVGFWPAIGAMLLVIPGALIATYAVIPNVRYGMDQYLGMRAWFGTKGIWPLVALIGLPIGWGWCAMLMIMAGRATSEILTAFQVAAPDWRLIAILLSLIAVYVGWKGGIALSWLSKLVMPIIFIVTISFIVLFAVRIGWSEILSATPVYATGTPYDVVVAASLGLSWIIWYVALSQVLRLCKSENTAVGSSWFGTGVLSFFTGFVGIISALYVGDPDPTTWLIPIGGLGWGLFSLAFIIFANIGSTAVSFFATGETIHALIPRLKWEYGLAILLVGVIILCIFPFVYFAFDVYMMVVYLLLAPLVSIALVDFFILKKQKIKITDCYTRRGAYYYWGGFNWIALAVWFFSFIFGLMLFNPLTFEPYLKIAGTPIIYYTTDIVPVMVISAIVYYLCGKFILVKRFPQAYE